MHVAFGFGVEERKLFIHLVALPSIKYKISISYMRDIFSTNLMSKTEEKIYCPFNIGNINAKIRSFL